MRDAVRQGANLRQFSLDGSERVEIRRNLRRGISNMVDQLTASQIPTPAKSGHCALWRANHVFGTDEKRIRTKNMVMDKSNHGFGLLLSKIADCVRTGFRPRAIGDPRGRVAVRASA